MDISIYIPEVKVISAISPVRLTSKSIPLDASILSIDEFQIKFVVEKCISDIKNVEIRMANLMKPNLSSN